MTRVYPICFLWFCYDFIPEITKIDDTIQIDAVNNDFTTVFNFVYKSLAENNETIQKFYPENQETSLNLHVNYYNISLLKFQTIGKNILLEHVLYRKVFLERNYNQNIKDAVKKIQARINATSTTKNEKVQVIMSTLISLAIVRLVLQ
ncbi:hypothetical protein BDAP_002324 [Binucleata daphniae]